MAEKPDCPTSTVSGEDDWINSFMKRCGFEEQIGKEYKEIFNENRIQETLLSKLNFEYLRGMGIKAVGDIITILNTIAEVLSWLDHLKVVQEHRKGGAKKAAETRRKNKEAKGKEASSAKQKTKRNKKTLQSNTAELSDSEVCQTCQKIDPDCNNDEDVLWVQCDICLDWHHQLCLDDFANSDAAEWHCPICCQLD